MSARRLVLVAAVLLSLPSVQGAIPLFDDAGTGADASGSRAAPTAVPLGSHLGNMTPQDADWYSFPSAGSLGCVELDVTADHAATVAVGSGGSTVEGLLASGGELTTTVALAPGAPLLFGIVPDTYAKGAASVGPYAFAAARVPAASTDGPGVDVPATRGGAAALPGTCVTGVFQDDGPDVDVYSFTATAGDRLTWSFAAPVGTLALWNGTAVVDTLAPGEVDSRVLSESGTYYVAASGVRAESPIPYAAALVLGPDPNGCRPYCFAQSPA